MLSSLTLNCQPVTQNVMNSGSQLSELKSVSQRSHASKIFFVIFCWSGLIIMNKCRKVYCHFHCQGRCHCQCICLAIVMIVKNVKMLVRSFVLITLIKCLTGHKSLGTLGEGHFVVVFLKKVAQSVSQSGHLLSCRLDS